MKMSFRRRNNNYLIKEKSKEKFFLSVVAVVFIILFFSISWTRNLLFSVGSPLWNLRNNTVSFLWNNLETLNSKESLIKENSLLKEQIKSDEKNTALFDILQKENSDLKDILNRSNSNQKLLLAAVLVKPFLSAYDTLIIDVGSANGVSIGDEVLVDGNIFIGYVSEVYDNQSKVVLYSSSGEKTKVLIGDSNVEKEAIGMGDGNFSVEIPKEIDVKEGDSIVMPSISANVFGVVEKIESKESDSFQDVLFKSPVNISELKWVEVSVSNKK